MRRLWRLADALALLLLVMLGLGLSVWPGLLTWAVLIALIAGFAHMPALDDVTPLDARRFAFGALALAVLVLTLMPLPAGMRGLMLDCPYMRSHGCVETGLERRRC